MDDLGVASNHRFLEDFLWNKPSSDIGTPAWLWNPPISQPFRDCHMLIEAGLKSWFWPVAWQREKHLVSSTLACLAVAQPQIGGLCPMCLNYSSHIKLWFSISVYKVVVFNFSIYIYIHIVCYNVMHISIQSRCFMAFSTALLAGLADGAEVMILIAISLGHPVNSPRPPGNPKRWDLELIF